jgi:protein gp37
MTSIEWTDATWNPIAGCSIVSPGCTHCYAMRQAARIERMIPSLEHYKGLTKPSKAGPVWTGKVALAPEKTLLEPLRRRKPTMYFVNSMSDLFHEDVPNEWIDRIFAVMALCPQHTFQVLTKRAERMRRYCTPSGPLWEDFRITPQSNVISRVWLHMVAMNPDRDNVIAREPYAPRWPLPNVWLGVSAERQQEADERIPHLLATPAAVRFVSLEPLLGPIELWRIDEEECALRGVGVVRSGGMTASTPDSPPEGYDDSYPGIDWAIVGGESGRPDARQINADWVRSLRDQCQQAQVPFFFKQWGAWWPDCQRMNDPTVNPAHGIRVGKKAAGRLLDGRTWDEMPTPSKSTASVTESVP